MKALYFPITLTMLMLLAACHDAPAGQVLARVNGRDITETEIAAEARAGAAPRPELLDRLIDRALFADEARRRGADLSPTYLADVRRARDLLLADSLRRQIAALIPMPDDGRAQNYVAAHRWTYVDRAQVTLVAPDGAASGFDTATLDPATASLIGSVPVGGTVKLAGHPYRVAARKPLPVAPRAALDDARAALVADETDRQMRAILGHSRAIAAIRYQTGFGPAQE